MSDKKTNWFGVDISNYPDPFDVSKFLVNPGGHSKPMEMIKEQPLDGYLGPTDIHFQATLPPGLRRIPGFEKYDGEPPPNQPVPDIMSLTRKMCK